MEKGTLLASFIPDTLQEWQKCPISTMFVCDWSDMKQSPNKQRWFFCCSTISIYRHNIEKLQEMYLLGFNECEKVAWSQGREARMINNPRFYRYRKCEQISLVVLIFVYWSKLSFNEENHKKNCCIGLICWNVCWDNVSTALDRCAVVPLSNMISHNLQQHESIFSHSKSNILIVHSNDLVRYLPNRRLPIWNISHINRVLNTRLDSLSPIRTHNDHNKTLRSIYTNVGSFWHKFCSSISFM